MANCGGGQLAHAFPCFLGKGDLQLLKIEWGQETGSASPWTVIYGAQVEGQEACPSASKTNSGWGYYGGTGVLLF